VRRRHVLLLGHLLRRGGRYDVVHTASFPYFSLLAAGAARPRHGYGLVVDWHEVWTRGYWEQYLGRAGGAAGYAVQLACVRIPQRAFCFSRLHRDRLVDEGLRSAPEILEVVREGMRRVVHEPTGTAHQNPDGSTKWPLTNPPNEPPIQIAGKTGTAEIGEQDAEGNYERQHAWFTCFAPLEAPEIAISVVVEEQNSTGGQTAAPVAREVLQAILGTAANP